MTEIPLGITPGNSPEILPEVLSFQDYSRNSSSNSYMKLFRGISWSSNRCSQAIPSRIPLEITSENDSVVLIQVFLKNSFKNCIPESLEVSPEVLPEFSSRNLNGFSPTLHPHHHRARSDPVNSFSYSVFVTPSPSPVGSFDSQSIGNGLEINSSPVATVACCVAS